MKDKEIYDYFQSSEFKRAFQQYEEMKANNVPAYFEADTLIDIAEYYARQQRNEEAEEATDFALKLHPDNADALIFKARTFLYKDDVETAKRLADSVAEREYSELAFLYAEIELVQGNPNGAADLLEREILSQEDNYDPVEEYMNVRDIFLLFSDYDFPNVTLTWGERLHQIATKEIAEDSREAYRLEAEEFLANIYCQVGRYAEAIPLWTHVIEGNPYNKEAWLRLGIVYAKLARHHDSLDALDYALAIDNTLIEAYFYQGLCYTDLGNYEEAIKQSLRCFDHEEFGLTARYNCGYCYIATSRFTEAIEVLEPLFGLFEENSDIFVEICHHLTIAHSALGLYEKAHYYFDLACKYGATHPMTPRIGEMLEKSERLRGYTRKKGGEDTPEIE